MRMNAMDNPRRVSGGFQGNQSLPNSGEIPPLGSLRLKGFVQVTT